MNESSLKKELKDFVDKKIKYVRSVDDILKTRTFVISKTALKCQEYSADKLYQFKKVLQITINMHNNPEVFKDLKIKFVPKCDTATSPLAKCYRHDKTDNLWTFVESPKKGDVVDAIYNYLLCLLSNQHLPKDDVVLCPYCDLEIKSGDGICYVCDGNYEDIIKNPGRYNYKETNDEDDNGVARKENTQPQRDTGRKETWICTKCDCKNEQSEHSCTACGAVFKDGRGWCKQCQREDAYGDDRCEKCRRGDIHLTSGERSGEMPVEFGDNCGKCAEKMTNCVCGAVDEAMAIVKDRWTCGQCGYFNEYKYANCVTCTSMYKEGKWRCEHCDSENGCATDECGTCGCRNMYVDTPRKTDDDTWTCGKCGGMTIDCVCDVVNAEKKMSILKDQWKCVKCELCQSFNLTVCDACGASRAENGLWCCDSCTLINKCDSAVCTVCGKANEHLRDRIVRYCHYCKSGKVRQGEVRCDECARNQSSVLSHTKWCCENVGCNTINKWGDKYCDKCHLEHSFSHFRGEAVKILDNGRNVTTVWICNSCHTFNGLMISYCRTCTGTRYGKKKCRRCNITSEGTSRNCIKCHYIL